MMIFQYRSKGSADDWTEDTIEAEDKAEAIKKLDTIYAVERDKNGKQTNGDMVQVELV